MKTKILICGGTGFIGRNLVEFFAKKKNFRVFATYNIKKKINIPKVKWIKTDLRNPKAVERTVKGMKVLIQAAATTSGAKDIIEKPQIHVTDNAIMNSYILKYSHEHNLKHVIFFSCTVMYPNTKRKLNENQLILGEKINKKYFGVAQTKIYIENLCKFYSNIGKTKFTCIRHSNVYGPHDKFDPKKSHFFGANISRVVNTQEKFIEIWGNGNEKRDLIHVNDLKNFVSLVIKKQKKQFRIYNCSYGIVNKVKDVIKKIIYHSKKKIKIKFDISKPSIQTNILVDSALAHKELGWKPKISLNKGIISSIKWYKKNYLN